MDKYDLLLLDIIHNYKENGLRMNIGLHQMEKLFWKRIESHDSLTLSQARIGERITRLYLDSMVENKGGYCLTKKGRSQLAEVEAPYSTN
jgi:hypothetical protein